MMRTLRGQQGQTATIILIMLTGLLLLSMTTFNVGMVGLTKTDTANAADAAAIAASSWVASSQNEVALGPANSQWVFKTIMQAIFLLPFLDLNSIITVWFLYTGIQETWYASANELLAVGWGQAHGVALMSALQNLDIDDSRPPTDPNSYWAVLHKLEGDIRAAQQDTSGKTPYPTHFEHTWDRLPNDPDRGEQTVTVNVEFSNVQPTYTMSMWGPILWYAWPPIGWCSWPIIGYKFKTIDIHKRLGFVAKMVPSYIPWISGRAFCFPLIFPMLTPYGSPNKIENGDGKITVTVTRTSPQDAKLRLWQMHYPQVTSVAKAQYNAADVSDPPQDTSDPHLIEVH